MEISSDLVREIREKTGAGMLDCKKALVQANGDMNKAITLLREKGLASAEKKSGRITKEGLVHSYIHSNGKIGVLIEVNCETDFVARNEKFQQLVKDIAMHVAAMNPRFLSDADISDDVKAAELAIYKKQAAESGKPANVLDKIVDGRYKKFCDEVCLLNQAYVKDPNKKVIDYVKETIAVLGENISVRRFVRWQLGEQQ